MRRVLTSTIPYTFIINYSSSSSKLHHFTSSASPHLPNPKPSLSPPYPLSTHPQIDPFPLKQHLLRISHVCPETSRKFLRTHDLKPQNLLEILVNFEVGSGELGIEHGKVESLWGIFKWAVEGFQGFEDLDRCCQVMGSLLLRVGMVVEVESFVSRMMMMMENGGSFAGCDRVLSDLIVAYVDGFEVEKAVSVYDRMKVLGLEPTLECYRALLGFLMEMDRMDLVFRGFEDMVEAGFRFDDVERKDFEGVIRMLVRDGNVQQARKLVRKTMALGLEPSRVVLNEIGGLFCEKKDFDDLLCFFVDVKCVPGVTVCNKAIHSLCESFGLERADLFLQEVKRLGFQPNEVTFGILICWSCHYGKLRDAFIYFSEIISNGMSPVIRSYNALISGLFKEGMWQHAREVVKEMFDNGTQPDLVTYKVLLAGYCKARQFGEVKSTINDMVNNALIRLSPLDDPLSRAFMILGVDAKVKRDNNKSYSRTEFHDDLGNGLYLETDLDTFEQVLLSVLEESMVPDFNQLVVRECERKNLKVAWLMVDEMALWGQELSLSAFTALARAQSVSHDHALEIHDLLNKIPTLITLIDQEVLTLLVNSLCEKGFTEVGPLILKEMCRRHQPIENNACTSLMLGICKAGEARTIRCCWNLVRKTKWLPELKDCDALLDYLCRMKMAKETSELLNSMLASHPHLRADICNVFLGKLCSSGYTELAREVIYALIRQGCELEPATYSHLVRGYCLEKGDSEALVLFDYMMADQMVPCADTIVHIILVLCRAKRVEDATTIMEIGLREDCFHAVSLYNALISGCCEVGEVAKASTLFTEMFSKQLIPGDDVYGVLFREHCVVYDMKKVSELLCAIIRKSIPLSVCSYRKFVHMICEKEPVLSPLSLKRLLFPECRFSSVIMFNIIIFHLFHKGNHHLVDVLLNGMQEVGLEFDEVTSNFLIYGYATCKQMNISMQYFNSMISKDHRPSNRTLRVVAHYFCSNGEVQKALDLTKHMESKGWAHSSVVQHDIVNVLLSGGRIHEAESFLARMEEKGLTPDKIDYNNLIRKFCSHERLDTAINLLNIMLKRGSVPDSASYDSVVYSSCVLNKLDRALDFFNEMVERKLSPAISTFNILVHNLCQSGQTSEAERVLFNMIEHGLTPTRRMYCCIVDNNCSQKNLTKASEFMGMMQRDGYEPDFGTQWFLVSNMWSFSEKDESSSSLQPQGFLSKLLSDNGFSPRNGLEPNVH